MVHPALILFSAALFAQEDITITVSASRQDSLSKMDALKRLKLNLYALTMCADDDVRLPSGRIVQALSERSLAVESSLVVPMAIARAKSNSTLGLLLLATQNAGGLWGVAVAAGQVGAGPLAAIPTVAGYVASQVRQRQDKYEELIIPILSRLLRGDEVLLLGDGQCEERFALSASRKAVESTIGIRVRRPLRGEAPRRPTAFQQPPWALSDASQSAPSRRR